MGVHEHGPPLRSGAARRKASFQRPPRSLETTTFVAGLRLSGMAAPMALDGPINGRSFQAYVDQVLVPELKPGDVVIMDNLGSHKGQGVRAAIEAAGARLLYLPPYSPDFNPIENASPSLRRCSERQPNDPSTASGTPSHASRRSSPPPNAPTSSKPQDTSRNEGKTL